ncbi:Uma2 family endonuclease [Phormidium pseudopriestleyi FRX01]|uniref:Uma2 family endonuclease n=1 Tax=Phormidium pseudopriestleyi FRX01 TaxID=1759528 RepID=A0ABS3FVK3_9CYAN|nr:Uma2 family endonuclease [Phormidium pseudopriestleyi]MBO0350798.1 Uma2 family endonuclease [Phormidium pseudopriestleyi FRX01]
MSSTTSQFKPLTEGRVLLQNISWKTYERLLNEMGDHRNTRLNYDRGLLEIMTPLFEHENPKRILEKFVDALADVLNIEILSAGSTTLNRPDLARGSEPDSGFYIQNEQQVKGKRTINLKTDPPPDLVIEVDVTSSSIDREGIYAAMGVPEIWRCDRGLLKFLQLRSGNYIETEHSLAFPLLPVTEVAKFLEQSQTVGETTLLKAFRAWVREQIQAENK